MSTYNNSRKPKAATVEALQFALDAMEEHKKSVTAAFSKYRKEVKKIGEQYSESYAKEKRADALGTARVEVEAADIYLKNALKISVKDLRDSLREIVAAPVPADFANCMRLYKDFGLKMSKAEVEAFAVQTQDSFPAARILAVVAKDSGYRVNLPSVEQMQKDIRELEHASFIPTLYCPDGFITEGQEVYPSVPLFRDDGSVYGSRGKPTTITLLTSCNYMDSLCERIGSEMLARWKRVQPVIEQVNSEDYNSAEEAEKAQAELDKQTRDAYVDAMGITPDGSKLAEAMASRAAEEQRKSAEILEKYM